MTTNNCANTYIVFGTSDEITMPLQPVFLATNSASDLNRLGNGVYTPLVDDNVEIDTGSDYDNTTGIFTAPENGKYFFTQAVSVSNLNAAHVSTALRFPGGNSFSLMRRCNPWFCKSAADNKYCDNSFIFEVMDAADTENSSCYVQYGTQTVTVDGDALATTYFSGLQVF